MARGATEASLMSVMDSQPDGPQPPEPGPREDKLPERTVEIRPPPVLCELTAPLVEQLEQTLGGVFVSYWNSPNASMRHDDVAALDHVLRRIRERDDGQRRVFLFIKSDGGEGTAALRMTNILRHWADQVT